MELKEIQKLEGHTDRVWSLAWNPATGDSGIPLVFASCSGDKTVRIWEQNLTSHLWSCKVFSLLNFNHRKIQFYSILVIEENCSCISFSLIIKCCENEMQAVLEDTHTRTVRSCAWSPSGKLLATASFDATTAIYEDVGGDFECVSTLEVGYC